MKILVTGGAGYIGSHMCKLLSKNHEVFILDNLSTGFRHLAKYGTLIEADLTGDLSWIKDYNFGAVFHFAASSIVQESVEFPMKYYYNNVFGTINLLSNIDIKTKFIFSSTAAIFGNPEYYPIDENHPKNPINPYGKSKLMVEQILDDAFKAYGLSSVCLRYFNAAGADSDGELGECHNPETHLIPLVLKTAKGIRDKISIFGNDYDTPDGTCIRDYIHVEDLCEAHSLALEFLENNSGAFKFNLGNGTGYSVNDIISAVQTTTGKKVNTSLESRRSGDPSVLIADQTLSKQCLNWSPKKLLSDIIQDAWNWENKN